MTTTNHALVAGVFTDEDRAQQAMTDLQNAGFTDDEIRYSVHRGGSGIADALVKLGFTQEEADHYNQEFLGGRTIVTVNSPDRRQEAYDILQRNGASDMHSQRGQSATATGMVTDAATISPQTTENVGEGEQHVPLRQEQLTATKQREQVGEVDIHKRVVTEEKTLSVPASHEEVFIERHPVNPHVPSDAPPLGQKEHTRIPVSEEQVQVTKQPVVTEEIDVGKRTVQENQQVSDTVRREEASIENQGDVHVVDGSNSPTNMSSVTDPANPNETDQ